MRQFLNMCLHFFIAAVHPKCQCRVTGDRCPRCESNEQERSPTRRTGEKENYFQGSPSFICLSSVFLSSFVCLFTCFGCQQFKQRSEITLHRFMIKRLCWEIYLNGVQIHTSSAHQLVCHTRICLRLPNVPPWDRVSGLRLRFTF